MKLIRTQISSLLQNDTDILDSTFNYLDVSSLVHSRLVSNTWKSIADNSIIWKQHCRILWEGKQYLTVEPWVRVTKEQEVTSEEIARSQVEYLLLLQTMQSDSNSELDDMLSLLDFLRVSSKRREAAPLSKYFREQQIEIENMYELSQDSALENQIIKNINTPLLVSPSDIALFRESGTLLSWRESYIASLVDSTRMCFSYSELRFQGEWLADFYQTSVTIAGFINGGHRAITNISFYDRSGEIILKDLRLFITELDDVGYFVRDPTDWGWIIIGRFGGSIVTSFDRRFGYQNYNGKHIMYDAGGNRREVQELKSPLKNIPMNGFYCV